MMMNAMSCEGFSERLPAYLEQDADDATRVAVERHAAACVECGAILADLRKIRADAANLPDLAPARDLWAGIAERIETPVVSIAAPVRPARFAWARSTRAMLFAASLVGAAAIGYLGAGVRRGDEPAPTTIASVPDDAPVTDTFALDTTASQPAGAPGVVAPPTQVAQSPAASQAAPSAPAVLPAQLAVATLTSDYDREIGRLRRLLDERRNQLDPTTVAVIEKNLLVIDAAILDAKKAIAADPASAFLIETLNQSLRIKMELMRTAAALPIRM